MENSGTEIVYGNVQYWKDDKKEYIYSADHTHLDTFMSINHPAVFVKKSVYKNLGLFDENFPLAMDYELMLRFFTHNIQFRYIDKVLSNMALGGVSDINWRQAYREAYEIRKKYLGGSFKLYIYYLFQVWKRHISNLVSNIGLEHIKTFYRSRFSTIQKSRSK